MPPAPLIRPRRKEWVACDIDEILFGYVPILMGFSALMGSVGGFVLVLDVNRGLVGDFISSAHI